MASTGGPRTRPPWSQILAALGVVCLLAAALVIGLGLMRGPGDPEAGPTRPDVPHDVPRATDGPRASDAPRATEAPFGRTDDAWPAVVEIPAVAARERVVPVGTDRETGELRLPLEDVGWYRRGADLGASTGSTVLAGHVDDGRTPTGPFARLADLRRGRLVVVTDRGGDVHRFRVVARSVHGRDDLPTERIFARSGPRRLFLVSCTNFDAESGHYLDNIVVTAEPLGGR